MYVNAREWDVFVGFAVLGFLALVGLIVLMILGAYRYVMAPAVSTQCIDGIVQQGVPGDWEPVKLKDKDVTIPCP